MVKNLENIKMQFGYFNQYIYQDYNLIDWDSEDWNNKFLQDNMITGFN